MARHPNHRSFAVKRVAVVSLALTVNGWASARYDLGLITLGGGIVLHNADRVLAGIHRHVEEYLLTDGPDIAVTELGGDIGIHGAMALPEWTEPRPRPPAAQEE